jgi:lactoylglutathione lyase
MRTLHVGLRVRDRQRSLAFYQALGYELVQWPPGHPDGMTAADWPDSSAARLLDGSPR